MKTEIEFFPYGEVSSALAKGRWRSMGERARGSSSRQCARHNPRVFVSYSQDLDESFVEMFREKATADTRLLILNEGSSTDRLLSRIVDLQIRTPQRFYIVSCGSGKTHHLGVLYSLLNRLMSAHEADDKLERILDATIDGKFLRVVSSNFNRLDVPIRKIPEFSELEAGEISEFEIDEEGAFIYWPALDLHLGWPQLLQLINPEAALKASQKSREFNKRYGKAVRQIREKKGLKPGDIAGLSEKQLRRIETGACRLTSNAIEALAKAHKVAPNDYMQKLAEALE